MNDDTTRGTPGDTPGRPAEADRRVGDKADAMAHVQDKLADAGRDARDLAAEVAEGAREKAEEAAEQGKAAGAGRMEGFARAARHAADDIADESPELARYVRQAAGGLEHAAASVKSRSVGEILDLVEDFARRQPTAYFGSSVFAGFLLSRFMKSRADRPRGHDGERRFGQGFKARRDMARRSSGASHAQADRTPTPSSVEEMP